MKKLSILLTVCILFGMLSLCVSADDSISTENPGSLDIFQPEPVYSPYTTAWGETYMVDSEGRIAGEIIVNLDVLIDIEPYNNGTTSDFFGVSITKIEKLFLDELIDNFIARAGNVFSYLITLDNSQNINSALNVLADCDHVLAVGQNNLHSTPSTDYDTDTAATGHYDLIGVSTAWDRGFVGSDDVVVAVIDVGMDVTSEFDNNVDYDLSYNVTSTGSSSDITPTMEGYLDHGNAVASVICADLGDGGVNGICQNVTVVPIKYHGAKSTSVRAFTYAISIGADIINLSFPLGDNEYTDEIFTSITNNADVLIVTSAGNNNMLLENDSGNSVKANEAPNWIVVGASDIDDTKRSSSNWSETYVDLFAPGTNVPIAKKTSSGIISGTSIASPIVAAAAALIMSHATHLSAIEVANMLRNENLVDQVDALDGLCVTGGRLAIDKLVGYLYTCNRGAYTKGDVNGDGFVDMFDYNATKNVVLGQITFTTQHNTAADVNNDNVVDVFDYMIIKQFALMQYYFIP